jgi:hypothetical protein
VKLKINQFSKRIKINFKNEAQNWHKNKNNVVIKRWIVKNNNFYKSQRKKLEIKTMMTKLENIAPSIWIKR